MPQFTPDVWGEARRLVVEEGRTYAEAAEATGLARSTLEKRAARERWRERRDSALSYEQQVRALKAALLAKALEVAEGEGTEAVDAGYKAVQTWKQVESAYPEHRYSAPEQDPQLRLTLALELLTELVAWLGREAPSVLTAFQPLLRPFAEHLRRQHAAA